MYSSGILGKCGLAVWAPNAALTHAVSDTLTGVYTAQDIIMRGSNPQITQFNGKQDRRDDEEVGGAAAVVGIVTSACRHPAV